MTEGTENQSQNTGFTHRHENIIDQAKEDLFRLKATIYGSEQPKVVGLEARVEALEKGAWRKVLSRQNITIAGIAATLLGLVAALLKLFG